MGIDGIGKPGVPPVGVGSLGPTTGPERGETFAVSGGAKTEEAQSVDALGRVSRGELGIDEYLNLRVAEATRHLDGQLPQEQLEFVRLTLREQLNTDPVLVELVRRTTGNVPGGGGQ